MGQDSSGSEPRWHRGCESGACVEVAFHNDAVKIRSSVTPSVVITLTREEWDNFLDDAKNGLFDELEGAA